MLWLYILYSFVIKPSYYFVFVITKTVFFLTFIIGGTYLIIYLNRNIIPLINNLVLE